MGGGLKCKRGERRVVLECEKLIIAAGVNSIPKFPENLSWSGFSGLVTHSKSIGANQSLLTSSHIQRVTEVGGNKSAFDAVFLCAVKVVDWVISPDGYGPGILLEPRTKGGTSFARVKLARVSLIPGPTVLNQEGWWWRFLNSGSCGVGTWVLRIVMRVVTRDALGVYGRNERTKGIGPNLTEWVLFHPFFSPWELMVKEVG